MIEWLMIFALGFLTAGLLALALFPAVHARASRLAARRVMVDIPISMAEIGADRDALRAEFAVSRRRLEMRIEELTTKLAEKLAQLGKKSDEVNCLRIELAAREAQISALPARKAPVADHSRETRAPGLGHPVPPGERSLRQRLGELAEPNPDLATSPLVSSAGATVGPASGRTDDGILCQPFPDGTARSSFGR